MEHPSTHEAYLDQFAAALQRRGADQQRITDAVVELERKLAESGQDPADRFGPPDEYAERVIMADERSGDAEWDWRTFRGTAFDEMDVLDDAGKQGWELVDVGAYALYCRRPRRIEDATQWEYRRRVGVDRRGTLETMTTLGWEPAGTWMPFQYFKRNLHQPAQLPHRAA
jgi:hypothetical protein